MNIQNKIRIVLSGADITAEFYSWPQRYIVGLSDDAEFDTMKASLSSFLAIGSSDSDKPTLGQFNQQSMAPHIDQFKMYVAAFSGETGLTMDDLGFATENPSSADAIKSSHENLRLTARKAQRTFGSGFLNVGYVAACMRDNYPYQRNQIYMTTPEWKPLFEPDASQMSGIGDAAIKLNQAVPGYFNKDNLEQLIGIEGGDSTEETGETADIVDEDKPQVGFDDGEE